MFPVAEKLDIFKDEYLPLIINMNMEEFKPSFEEYLKHRVHPLVGKKVFRKGNWYLIQAKK